MKNNFMTKMSKSVKMRKIDNPTYINFISVAGSTSLILLVVRLLVTHVMIPRMNKVDPDSHTLEGYSESH